MLTSYITCDQQIGTSRIAEVAYLDASGKCGRIIPGELALLLGSVFMAASPQGNLVQENPGLFQM